jgi:hypothetical protein
MWDSKKSIPKDRLDIVSYYCLPKAKNEDIRKINLCAMLE